MTGLNVRSKGLGCIDAERHRKAGQLSEGRTSGGRATEEQKILSRRL